MLTGSPDNPACEHRVRELVLRLSSAEVDRLRHLGATGRHRPERHVPACHTSMVSRSFSLLRAIDETAAQDRPRQFVLQAYRANEQEIGPDGAIDVQTTVPRRLGNEGVRGTQSQARKAFTAEEQAMDGQASVSEVYLTVVEVAERLKINEDTVRRLFLNEPGVVVICFPRKGRRVYRTVRIPESVFQRVLARLTSAP
jgi:hypothetical protein